MSVCTSLSDEVLVRRLVELTEAGLPLVADPWAWLADELGLEVDDTLALLQRLQAEGAIRRIAAVPNHYRLGYRHNGMTVGCRRCRDRPSGRADRCPALRQPLLSTATPRGLALQPVRHGARARCQRHRGLPQPDPRAARQCLSRERDAGVQSHPEEDRPAPGRSAPRLSLRRRCRSPSSAAPASGCTSPLHSGPMPGARLKSAGALAPQGLRPPFDPLESLTVAFGFS